MYKENYMDNKKEVQLVLASIKNIVSYSEVRDIVLVQKFNDALLKAAKVDSPILSKIDDMAPAEQLNKWLQDCLVNLDLDDLVFGVELNSVWKITVVPETNWLWRLLAEWKTLFFVSPKQNTLLELSEEEYAYEARLIQL